MNYAQALEFIHSIASLGSKPGLRRVSMLLERMQNPQDRLKFIHVAGTNGKGSTSTMISYILSEAGYKTGLFISPFVLDFRERIQLNNEMISKDELVTSLSRVKPHWDALNEVGEPPTEFEVVLAVAMDFYSRMDCEAVVLEVGLGGRFDATNVIKAPLCSVITAIDLDHTGILGDTVAQIAFEKCGIIKENGITVSYPEQQPEAVSVIEKICKERENRLFTGGKAETLSMDISGSRISYKGMELYVPLTGEHQILNAVTAVEAVKAAGLAGLEVTDEAVINGIAKTRFPARFEILSKSPLVILDGAHNPSKVAALSETIKLLGQKRIHAVVAAMSDKDVDGMLKSIVPCCETVTAVTAIYPRAMNAEDIAAVAKKYCGRVYTAKTLPQSLDKALSLAEQDGGAVLIFGSLYLAADMRRIAAERLTKDGTFQ